MKNYRIGVDIGGTSFKYGIVDEEGKILFKSSYLVNHQVSQEEQIIELGHSILALMKKENIALDDILGIGIGCPGSINPNTGYCDYSNNLRWNNLPVRDLLFTVIPKPIRISNDANAATLGEARYGIGKGYHNIVMLTLGTGVGGGLILNDQLYEGNEGKGAELGHTILHLNGRKCTCGRKGCIEAYASVRALVDDTKKAMKEDKTSSLWKACEGNVTKLNARIIYECAKENDGLANQMLNQYYEYLKETVLNYINIFRPELLILGGGISAQKEHILSHLIPLIEKEHYGFGNGPKVKIECASLGNDAGIIGAACLIEM